MRIALVGYGKMGVAIEEMAELAGHTISYKIDKSNQEQITELNPSNTEVVIEFSDPSSAARNIINCIENKIPVVCGTTGWLQDWTQVEKACEKHQGTFFYASNFSIGVNLFFRLNEYLAQLMSKQNYKVGIEEIHHTEKKDSPSGTALSIAKPIMEAGNLKDWVNKASSNPEQLGIVSKREPGVPGTHIVEYTSEIDEISISHVAHSRKGFAKGALKVAEWVVKTKPVGMVSMKDFLKF